MKLKKIKKLAEPLLYIVLVAAFGFITSVVNHSQGTEQESDSKLMSYSMEQQIETLLTGNSVAAKEISL